MAVVNGTAASETLSGTAAADTITGAGGNDKALMGGGNDVFVWNPGDGSDTVEGGVGNDTLRFKGAASGQGFIVSAIAGRALFTAGADIMDLNDVERLELQPLGGGDFLTILAIAGTDLKQMALDLSNGTSGVGDGAVDTIEAFATEGANTINLTQTGNVISATGLQSRSRSPMPKRRMFSRLWPRAAMTRSIPRRFRRLSCSS